MTARGCTDCVVENTSPLHSQLLGLRQAPAWTVSASVSAERLRRMTGPERQDAEDTSHASQKYLIESQSSWSAQSVDREIPERSNW